MSKRHIAPLETGPIGLRLLEERDLPLTLAWRNQDHIRRWFFYSDPITPEQHRAWYAGYSERDDDFVFVIEEVRSPTFRRNPDGEPPEGGTTNGRPIGQAALYDIDWQRGTAEFGRLMIGPADAAGKGLAKEATQALVAAAFDQLGLREVHLEVFADNAKAIAIYEACGFQVTERTDEILKMKVSGKFGAGHEFGAGLPTPPKRATAGLP